MEVGTTEFSIWKLRDSHFRRLIGRIHQGFLFILLIFCLSLPSIAQSESLDQGLSFLGEPDLSVERQYDNLIMFQSMGDRLLVKSRTSGQDSIRYQIINPQDGIEIATINSSLPSHRLTSPYNPYLVTWKITAEFESDTKIYNQNGEQIIFRSQFQDVLYSSLNGTFLYNAGWSDISNSPLTIYDDSGNELEIHGPKTFNWMASAFNDSVVVLFIHPDSGLAINVFTDQTLASISGLHVEDGTYPVAYPSPVGQAILWNNKSELQLIGPQLSVVWSHEYNRIYDASFSSDGKFIAAVQVIRYVEDRGMLARIILLSVESGAELWSEEFYSFRIDAGGRSTIVRFTGDLIRIFAPYANFLDRGRHNPEEKTFLFQFNSQDGSLVNSQVIDGIVDITTSSTHRIFIVNTFERPDMLQIRGFKSEKN